jgi:hypothetical protein
MFKSILRIDQGEKHEILSRPIIKKSNTECGLSTEQPYI